VAEPDPDHAKLFGLAFGFVVVTLLQVWLFDEVWWRAILFAALISVGALAVELHRRRARR
jgi:hypothetical protein